MGRRSLLRRHVLRDEEVTSPLAALIPPPHSDGEVSASYGDGGVMVFGPATRRPVNERHGPAPPRLLVGSRKEEFASSWYVGVTMIPVPCCPPDGTARLICARPQIIGPHRSRRCKCASRFSRVPRLRSFGVPRRPARETGEDNRSSLPRRRCTANRSSTLDRAKSPEPRLFTSRVQGLRSVHCAPLEYRFA